MASLVGMLPSHFQFLGTEPSYASDENPEDLETSPPHSNVERGPWGDSFTSVRSHRPPARRIRCLNNSTTAGPPFEVSDEAAGLMAASASHPLREFLAKRSVPCRRPCRPWRATFTRKTTKPRLDRHPKFGPISQVQKRDVPPVKNGVPSQAANTGSWTATKETASENRCTHRASPPPIINLEPPSCR